MLVKQYLFYKMIKYILRIVGIFVSCLILIFFVGWGINIYQPDVNNAISEFVMNLVPESILDLANSIFITVKNVFNNFKK